MKQQDLVKAYIAVRELNKQPLSAHVARKIFDLGEKLRPAWDFQVQEEEKIYERYPDYNPESKGFIADSNSESSKAVALAKAEAMGNDFQQIADLDAEPIDFEPFTIQTSLESGLKISGEHIGYLKPFITFE